MTIDLLILTIYFICVAYVVYQMALSVEAQLEDQIVIQLDREMLQSAVVNQLRQQGVDGIAVEILDAGMAPLAKAACLSLQNNLARRVIRLSPGMRMDLVQAQVYSVVNPRQAFSATVTTEDSFGRNPDTQLLQPSAPLINLQQFIKLLPPQRTYALELLIGIKPMTSLDQPIRLLLPFRFEVGVLPGKAAIPAINWILKR
jgi:hypothetical protein